MNSKKKKQKNIGLFTALFSITLGLALACPSGGGSSDGGSSAVAPEARFTQASATVNEAEATSTTATIRLDAVTPKDVTINVMASGSATVDSDYSVSGTEGSPPDYQVTILAEAASQQFTVSAVDDVVDDDGEEVILTLVAGNGYRIDETKNKITVGIADDDGSGLVYSPSSVTVDEGDNGEFTVKLATQPTANVTITFASGDAGAVLLFTTSLTFTTTNWNTAQTVSFNAVTDNTDTMDETVSITAAVTSTDSNYNGIGTTPVTVNVTDDDSPPGITISTSSLSLFEGDPNANSEASKVTTYTVELEAQPTANVRIVLSSNDTGAVTVSPSSLTFTTNNWADKQTVTVTPVDDRGLSSERVSITATVSSTDTTSGGTGYNGLSVDPVAVEVRDNDLTIRDIQALTLNHVIDFATAKIGSHTYLYSVRDSGHLQAYQMNSTTGRLTSIDHRTDDGSVRYGGARAIATVRVSNNYYVFAAGSENGMTAYELKANDGKFSTHRSLADSGSTRIAGHVRALTTAQVGSNTSNTYLFAGGDEDGISVFRIVAGATSPGTLMSHVYTVVDNNTLNIRNVYNLKTAVVGGTTYLFAAGFGSTTNTAIKSGVSVFSVRASDGRLTNTYNIKDGQNGSGGKLTGTRHLATARVGSDTYLFVSAGTAHAVSSFRVSSSGTLTFVDEESNSETANNTSTRYTLNEARRMATAQVNGTTFLFVTGFNSKGFTIFSVNDQGGLKKINSSNYSGRGGNSNGVVHNEMRRFSHSVNKLGLSGPTAATSVEVGGKSYLFVNGHLENQFDVYALTQ